MTNEEIFMESMERILKDENNGYDSITAYWNAKIACRNIISEMSRETIIGLNNSFKGKLKNE